MTRSMNATPFALAQARFRECQLCEEFLSRRVGPRIEHALEGDSSGVRQTYLGLFLRALAWLRTLRKLDHPGDFQAVIVASRTIFEIAIDVTIMHFDPLNPHAKLVAWEQSAKLKSALQVQRFFTEEGKVPSARFAPQLRFIDTDTSRIEALRSQYWPSDDGKGRHPKMRWTGRDLSRDARAATKLFPEGEFAEFYETRYPQICWSTHGSGLAGIRFLSEADFPTLSSSAFGECVHFALVTAKVVLIQMAMLDEAMEGEFKHFRYQSLRLQYVTLLVPPIVQALNRAASASAPNIAAEIFKSSADDMRADIDPLKYLDADVEDQIAAYVHADPVGSKIPVSTVRACMHVLSGGVPDPADRRLLGILRALTGRLEEARSSNSARGTSIGR